MTHSAHLGSNSSHSRFSKSNSSRHSRRASRAAGSGAAIEGLENRQLFALIVDPYLQTTPAIDLANRLLLGTGINVLGATYTGIDSQAGTFSGLDVTSGSTRLAISDGVLLTTGLAGNAVGPNQSRGQIGPQNLESFDTTGGGDPDLESLVNPTNDPGLTTSNANALEITFTANASVQSILFDFIFGSEEFPRAVGAGFNDAFAAYLDGELISFDTDDNPITVENNFFQLNNSGLTVDDDAQVAGKTFVNFDPDLDYDGLTPVIRTQAPLNTSIPVHTLKFVIADTQDVDNDSGVFLANIQSSPQIVTGPTTDLPQPGVFNFSTVTYTRNETDLFATLTVVREGGTSGVATVDVVTIDGTALGGVDYTPLPVPTQLTFTDGQTALTITVPILDDVIAEGNESFFVALANPTNAAGLGTIPRATVTLIDNEFGVQFSDPVFTSREFSFGNNNRIEPATATITVELTAASTTTITVNYATTAGGSATATEDYTPVNGTLTFAPGEMSKTFTITVFDDFIQELTETVGLTLTSPSSPYVLGLTNPALLEIENLERAPSVTDIYFVTNERFTNGVAIRFSESLTELNAEDLANYDLYIRKESKRLGGSATRTRVPLTSAVYTDINRTVTITSAKPLRDNKVYEVIVNTNRVDGVESIQGDKLDGNYDNNFLFDTTGAPVLAGSDPVLGGPPDDFTGYLFRGKKLNYFDENGDGVGLQLKGPGKFELFRTVDRDMRQVRMLETTPDTILTGTYKPVELTDGVATIRTIFTGTGFRNRLPLAPTGPFIVQEVLPGAAKPNT